VIRLLTALFAFLDNLLGMFRDGKLEEQGRQQNVRETNDELNRQIELGEAALAVPDPDRDERLRNRFDRSRNK
jgi:hypothetical protein